MSEINPKFSFGLAKVDLGVIPDTSLVDMALAFTEGDYKYGAYNYRAAPVDVRTYHAAARRHLAKYWNGQDRDPKTRVKELGSVMACCGILLDAEVNGMLIDNRPIRARLGEILDQAMEVVAHLRDMSKDFNPPQYTELEYGKSATKTPSPREEGAAQSPEEAKAA